MRKLLSGYPKWLVFALAGLLGAGVFNAGYEFFHLLFTSDDDSRRAVPLLVRMFGTGVWFCCPSVGVAIAVFHCQRILLGADAEDFFSALIHPLAVGVLLGFLSGALAECLFQVLLGSPSSALFTETLRAIAWGLAGAGLGLTLSLVVPNLKKSRASLFGFAGGVAGGIGFIFVNAVVQSLLGSSVSAAGQEFANIAARLVGTSIIGLFVGLSVAVAEATAKEGYLRVVWGPGEFTRVNLGDKPVTVGSSRESTIRMASSAGYPPVVATFSLQNGQAMMVNHMSHSTHPLRNGNKLTLGSVVIEIHLFS
jgi:Ca-activated chloride channel family protein